jgi:hypothetical protein
MEREEQAYAEAYVDLVEECEVEVANASELVANMLSLRGGRVYWGRNYHVRDPDLVVCIQLSRPVPVCAHCRNPHRQLIVQTISSRTPGKGDGPRFLKELAAAYPGGGIMLQSTMESSAKAAQRAGMTEHVHADGCWDLCTRRVLADEISLAYQRTADAIDTLMKA